MTKSSWSRLAREFGYFLFYGIGAFVCAHEAFAWSYAPQAWTDASAGRFENTVRAYAHWWHNDAVLFVAFFLILTVARWVAWAVAKLVIRSLTATASSNQQWGSG